MLIQPTKSSHYLKIVYVCSAFFLFTNLLMAQTEGPPPEDLVKVFDYNADVVKNYEITPLDLNQKLEKDSLDLGAQYEVTHLFTNNEAQPLVIRDVQVSCSCVSPDWYKQAIPAGGTGWIKIKYTATIPGKRFTTIKVIVYDGSALKPAVVQPVKVGAVTKFPANN